MLILKLTPSANLLLLSGRPAGGGPNCETPAVLPEPYRKNGAAGYFLRAPSGRLEP